MMNEALLNVATQLAELSDRLAKIASREKPPKGESIANARQAMQERLDALGWTRYQLAERGYANGVTRTVTYEFLASKKTINSDDLDTLLKILGLDYVVVGKPRDVVEPNAPATVEATKKAKRRPKE